VELSGEGKGTVIGRYRGGLDYWNPGRLDRSRCGV